MTEPEENHESADTVQFLCATAKHETSLVESLEKTLKISHDNKSTGSPNSEETVGRKEAEQEEASQQDVCSPAAETKWEVGSQCLAVYSEDGQVYPASVVCLDGNRCRVRFTGYDNEEDVELSALQSPPVALPTKTSQEWRPGSRCRAVFSEDSLVYPAMVLWVKGQRCCVRFDDYNNEEELDICSLLNPHELHGPNRTSSKGIVWKRRGRREENLAERGGGGGGGGGEERRSTRRDDQLSFTSTKDTTTNQIAADKSTNPSVPLFPPFPPPDQLTSAEPLSFIPPPPPPLWTFGGKESTDSASSMLMLWYTCGFHTGSYMTQQKFRSTSKD